MKNSSLARSGSRRSKQSYKSRYLNKNGSTISKAPTNRQQLDLLNITIPIHLQQSEGNRSTKNAYEWRRAKGSVVDGPQNFIESVKVTRPGTGFAGKTSLIAPNSEQDNKSINSR